MTERTKHLQQVCPLCDAINDCAMATGDTKQTCWCQAEQFPQSLQSEPKLSANSERCICRTCLAKAQGLACAG